MTLRNAVSERQAGRAVRANRARQRLAEIRLGEIVSVADITPTYEAIDRAGDLAMESWFAQAYQSATDEDMRALIAQGFVIWQRTERAEEQHVRSGVGDSVDLLKANNRTWLGE